jgi:hypothetical protein
MIGGKNQTFWLVRGSHVSPWGGRAPVGHAQWQWVTGEACWSRTDSAGETARRREPRPLLTALRHRDSMQAAFIVPAEARVLAGISKSVCVRLMS